MKIVVLVVKIVLSVGLLFALAPRLDWSRVASVLLEPSTLVGIVLAVAALCVQSALATLRQIDLVALFEHRITFRHSLRVWLSGLFVSQVFVTFIAGDVVRSLYLSRGGIPLRLAGQAILLDRTIGLFALIVMVVACVPVILSLTDDGTLRFSLLALAGISSLACAIFLAAGFAQTLVTRLVARVPWKPLQHKLFSIALEFLSVSRFLIRSPRRASRIFGLSVVMHLLNVLAILIIVRCVGITASPWIVGAIVVPVTLLAMLPISFAGWGVREAAMVTGLGLVHIAPDIAVVVSVSFGFALLIASLPGMIALFYRPVFSFGASAPARPHEPTQTAASRS